MKELKVKDIEKSKYKIDSCEYGRPKVSIIIPVYNGEKYISLSIDSALRQTYDNLEVIVVNDGSTDNTEKICKKYGNKIKYIKKQNGGVSTALNLGIQEMTGEYFSWLSHDDLYYPEKIEKEIKYLENNNLVGTNTILYSDFSKIDDKGNWISDIIFDNIILNRNSVFSVLKGGINGITLLIPKKAFQDNGFFDENLKCVQDYELWFDLYKKGYKFIHIPDVLAITRIHPEQTTNVNPKVKEEGNDFWIKVIEYFKDEDKIKLYGSIYEYYYELFKFFDKGPYNKVIEYCKQKCTDIEQQNRIIIEKTKVSIVIPFYNDINYTIKSIRSVLDQTHQNIEILIINNSSTEDISEISKLVNDYKDKIKYIFCNGKQKKVELWDVGLQNSTGEYIILFDQYSTMEKNRIKVQLSKMIVSGVFISDTSYYENYDEGSKFVDCGFEDGEIVHKIINNCYFKMPVIMMKKDYLQEENIITSGECTEDIDIFLRILINNRILGINEPLNTIYKENKEIDIESKFASIVSFVCSDKRFVRYPREVSRVLNTYKELLEMRCDAREEKIIEQTHKEEIKRYAYMQSREFKSVDRIRKVSNKMSFKKQTPLYKLDTNAIMNSRINNIYRKMEGYHKKILNKKG